MTKRLNELFSLIKNCDLFADVGCDHGFISQMVLDYGKAKKVIISDVSKKSLQKAENLLKDYGDKVISIVSDGFNAYTKIPDQAIIAGMGGEEIIKILQASKFLPNRLILNPMKNVDKVRKFLITNGYKILKDYTILDSKFYDLILCEKGEDNYTQLEYIFGRDNLKNKSVDFIEKLKFYKKFYQDAINNGGKDKDLKIKLAQIEGVLNENKWFFKIAWKLRSVRIF